jgi:hypothetical protein
MRRFRRTGLDVADECTPVARAALQFVFFALA